MKEERKEERKKEKKEDWEPRVIIKNCKGKKNKKEKKRVLRLVHNFFSLFLSKERK